MFGVSTELMIYNEKIKWLEPVLVQWLRLNRDYMENYECTDSLYWYNERANVGAFAGAVWRSGGFALEEFVALKGKGETEGSGRVDLFINYAGHEIICEAKKKWIYLATNNKKDLSESINDTNQLALKDVAHTQNSFDAELGLAISFFPTYSKQGVDVQSSLNQFREAIKSVECSFYAWFKNDSGISLTNSNNEVCDAVAIVGVLA